MSSTVNYLGDNPVRVTFYGTRGSTPCAGAEFERFGGQTSCVVVEHEGTPVIFDLGTGLRRYGCEVGHKTGPYAATVLLTHIHWDHVQGLPFFAPLLNPETKLDVYGAGDCGQSFPDLIPTFMKPPYFPVTPDQLPATIDLHDVHDDDIGLGDVKVRIRPVPHTACTNGYRIDLHGVSIAYIPDHQEPVDNATHVDDRVLELCDGVDLLIHDSQFTPELFAERADWGHCTTDYAVTVARQANVSQLALFHHDPLHDDETVEALARDAAAKLPTGNDLVVFPAASGQSVELGPS